MDTQTLIRLIIGLLMTAVVLVFAAQASPLADEPDPFGPENQRRARPQGPPRHPHHHADQRGVRANPAAEMVDPRHRPLLHDVGLLHPRQRLPRGLRRPVQPEFPSRSSAIGTSSASSRTSSPSRCCSASPRSRSSGCVSEPKEHGRESRFYGSHTGGAWLILFMIFNVILTYALFRGSAVNTGNLPYGWGAFFSHGMGAPAGPAGHTANESIETSRCWPTSESC